MWCDRLRELRKKHNLTQTDLANILHVGTSTVSGWETGNYYPDFDKLISLCDYFHVSSDYMLERTDEPNNSSEHTLNINGNIKLLNYYNRLDEEDQDYIRGMMIKLYKEKNSKNSNLNIG